MFFDALNSYLEQGVDIQLGLAIENTKPTLAVKRRLACEMVKYWQLVIMNPLLFFLLPDTEIVL